jgi:hypothetical protein
MSRKIRQVKSKDEIVSLNKQANAAWVKEKKRLPGYKTSFNGFTPWTRSTTPK